MSKRVVSAVTQAIIPAAGLGTRNFVSPAIPKEMLAPWRQPLISSIVQEARAAGITHFVFVLSPEKRDLITRHFDAHPELKDTLRARGKNELADLIEQTHIRPEQISIAIQDKPLGLGHAVLCGREFVGKNPFAVLLPDEVMVGNPNCLTQMIAQYSKKGGNIIAAKIVPRDQTERYGMLQIQRARGDVAVITDMVEKPKPHLAPSNLAIVGRYILQPEIFAELEKGVRGANGEIQLTDAMAALQRKQPFRSLTFKGERFDCGNHVGLFHYAAAMAVRDPQFGTEVRAGLEAILRPEQDQGGKRLRRSRPQP